VFVVENDLGLYLLALESNDRTRKHEAFELTVDTYAPEEYIALAFYVPEPQKAAPGDLQYVHGLVLKPVEADESVELPTYERTGMIQFRLARAPRLEDWKTRILELV